MSSAKALRTARVANLGVNRSRLALKMGQLARVAHTRNPHILAPWKVPAAWAISTAYYAGEVVLANGYWWVCQGNGTSAGSGSGPSNADAVNVAADGTTQWLLLGAPTALSDDAQAPTITRQTTAFGGSLDTVWGLAVSSAADILRHYGGRQNPANTDRYRSATFNRSAGSTDRGSGGRFAFWSDAESIVFYTALISGGSEGPFRLIVDRRYVSPSAFSNSGANTYTKLSWGTRKARHYEFEGWSREGYIATLLALYTTSRDLIWKPDTSNDLRAYWISDSQSASHSFGPYAPGGGIPQRVGRLLGWNDVWNASIGGTGYINPGGGPYYTYGERVAEGLTRNPDIWVFYGSTNDNGQSSASITAAALAAFRAIRNGGSTAPIFVVGVEPVNANCSATEAAIADAVTQFNDPLTFFIPLANASPYPSIIGSYNRPASLSSLLNTNARDVNNSDGIHLMENVFQKHAEFIANGIKSKFGLLY